MQFMIDFENVRSESLRGAEYLKPYDSVTIFYSPASLKIEQRRIDQLMASGCSIELCKLHRLGKNALDYYIASRIGEIYGQGYTGMTAIISNDTGFRAVRDYWQHCSQSPRNIILRPDIETAIFASGENSTRYKQIRFEKKEVLLEEEFKKYEDQRRLRKALEDIFANTDYEKLIESMLEIMEPSNSLKTLYIDSLKTFGKNDGLTIYHKIKQINLQPLTG